MSLEVSIHEIAPRLNLIEPFLMRMVVTPISIIGIPLIVWQLYGIEAFFTDVVAVPVIVTTGYVVWSFVSNIRK